jgi:hypothetical protein
MANPSRCAKMQSALRSLSGSWSDGIFAYLFAASICLPLPLLRVARQASVAQRVVRKSSLIQMHHAKFNPHAP